MRKTHLLRGMGLGLGLVAVSLMGGCSSTPKRIMEPKKAAISNAINARAEDFKACYELEQVPQGDGNDPHGTVTTQFVIDATGAVSQARVTQTTLHQPKVENCVLDRLREIRFPKSSSSRGELITYPFRFLTR